MCLEQLCCISTVHAQEGLFRSFCLAILVCISVCVDGVSQDEGCCGSVYVAFVRVCS